MEAQQQPTTTSTAAQQMQKRTDYLSWDDYFMAVRSKDPNTQVGACIVNKERKIVGIGYNGLPWGCSDDEFPWARSNEDPLCTKYPYVCHAELNAILNKNAGDLRGCKLYVALFPCNECTKLIIQSGIEEVVYYGDKYHDEWRFARKMLDAAGVKYYRHIPKEKRIVIDFESIN